MNKHEKELEDKKEKIIMGDFNTVWKREEETHFRKKKMGSLLKDRMVKIVTKPTHHRIHI